MQKKIPIAFTKQMANKEMYLNTQIDLFFMRYIMETLAEISGGIVSGTLLPSDTLTFSLFGNDGWQAVVETFSGGNNFRLIGGLIFFFFWIVSLIRVIKDANARSSSGGFQFVSILMILFLTPIFGLPLYYACRPQGWKWDKTPRRQALLASLQVCENCHTLNSIAYTCCATCGEKLKTECRECAEWYVSSYEYCPFCGAPNIDKI